MLENILKVILAISISLLFVSYPIAVFKSYKYVKKNLQSISLLFFGDSKYYRKLDWANHFLIEMAVGSIAALRFRELKILKRNSVFSKGYLPLSPNMNDKNLNLLLNNHGKWYKSVTSNILHSSCYLLISIIIFFILK
ncbi:hypothetical protein MMP65_03795 [Acinetobacter sp. ANC 3926]|uniref:Uncharacterized protein n=1 Tax=Acinetobacter genomosp. 15BJ TaxID=106651 RepID=R9B279_9GAMM|nr:hypothetical protein [Acinetobacter genomosp. 15BJ]EOR08375.1 hypothetical protein F896_01670 [Acinetobacter genomosp. 15BJ]MCH7290585.1 hypothetical protein [Acinetobacter genomosp. 15BJ]